MPPISHRRGRRIVVLAHEDPTPRLLVQLLVLELQLRWIDMDQHSFSQCQIAGLLDLVIEKGTLIDVLTADQLAQLSCGVDIDLDSTRHQVRMKELEGTQIHSDVRTELE